MPVPNTFANATTSIPLSQLDANFATAITLGNTSIQLGNTVTTLNNMTFANVTVSSGSVTVANVTVTGVGTFAAGSNTAPSITTSGDTNTGFFFPAADTVATTTGGTERIRVDSSGNVGIGTSSPAAKLAVSDGTVTLITSPFAGSTGYFGTGTNHPLAFVTNSAERMRIDSSGNVGIGTSSPGEKLNVSTGAAEYAIQWNSTGSNNWVLASATNRAYIANKTTPAEVLTITNGGNVGIGTSSPSYRLDVRDTSNTTVHVMGTTSGVRVGASADAPVAGAGYVGTYSNNPLALGVNNSERMRIDTSGNLLVGTTTASGKITVDGTVSLTNQNYAYFALSGTTAVSGYGAGQNVGVSIWTSDRVSSTEFNARSDARLKKNVTPIPVSDAWHFIQNVTPIHYKWVNNIDDGHKFGFIAQDVVKAGFPNLVAQYPDPNAKEVTDPDGFISPAGVTLTVNYDQIVPILAAALRDSMSQIQELKAEFDAYKAAHP